MNLALKRITFSNFRNYQGVSFSDISPLTIFVGKNASGKTNFVEGIQLVTALRSFRRPRNSQLIKEGSDKAKITAFFEDEIRSLELSLVIEEHSKQYHLNGKKRTARDLSGLFPSVSFSPDDLMMIKGSNYLRRDFLDSLGVQISESYSTVLSDYQSIVSHKNALLKEPFEQRYIESLNDLIITCGAQLCWYRFSLYKRVVPIISEYYRKMSGCDEKFFAVYQPSWCEGECNSQEGYALDSREMIKENLTVALERDFFLEKERRRCLIGPHNDKIFFYIDGKSSKDYGSQGQQRTLALACRLSELSIIEERAKEKPLLLLDDVMSEIDEMRRKELMKLVGEGIQTFITATNLDYFDNSVRNKDQIIELPSFDRS